MESLYTSLIDVLPQNTQIEIAENGLLWVGIGMFGLMAFSARFFIQWIASEKKGESVIPTAFWYFSIVGSLLLLSYALHRGDIVFILSYVFNCLIYFRNLQLIFRKKNKEEEAV